MYNFINYHNNSKLTEKEIRKLEEYYQKARIQESYYMNLQPQKNFYNEVTLGNTKNINKNIVEVMENRTSFRGTNYSPLSRIELSTILFHAMSKKNSIKKPYPSAGGVYSVYLYVIVNNVLNVPKEIYLYDFRKHSLKQFKDISHFNITTLSNSIHYPDNVSAILFTSSLYIKSLIKYGERSYRFILLESGHIMQNIELLTAAVNGGGHCIGGFYDESIEKLLDLNKYEILTHGYLLYGRII